VEPPNEIAAAHAKRSGAMQDEPAYRVIVFSEVLGAFTLSGRLAKMSDQERWLNEILDILGLPRDTAYRDYTRELAERGASLEQIYGTLRSRMNARLS
jgi:hypothetical protein